MIDFVLQDTGKKDRIRTGQNSAVNTILTLTSQPVSEVEMAKASLPNSNSNSQTKVTRRSTVERDIALTNYYGEGYSLADCAAKFDCTLITAGRALRYFRVNFPAEWIAIKEQRSVRRFWANVPEGRPDECWEWQGNRHSNGYGRARVNGVLGWAHRFALSLATGQKLTLHVLHSCDNPPCCNPSHLREGTPQENMQDRDSRGRGAWQRKR